MYETFGSHQNVAPALGALVRLWRIAKMPGRAMYVMLKTEEEKRTEAEVSFSAPFAQMQCYALLLSISLHFSVSAYSFIKLFLSMRNLFK